MTEAEWLSCADPEPMVRALPAGDYQRELRLFAAACVRRVWSRLSDAGRAAVEASERFANGLSAVAELRPVVDAAEIEAATTYPGHSAPGAAELAASAAFDASSVWPRGPGNVLAATSCAASAGGCLAAEADDARYDQVFDSVRQAELTVQATILRELIRFPLA